MTDFTDPAAVYALLRQQGEIVLGQPEDSLVRRLRALAAKDGIAFAQSTRRSTRIFDSHRTVTVALHDGNHTIVRPDA